MWIVFNLCVFPPPVIFFRSSVSSSLFLISSLNLFVANFFLVRVLFRRHLCFPFTNVLYKDKSVWNVKRNSSVGFCLSYRMFCRITTSFWFCSCHHLTFVIEQCFSYFLFLLLICWLQWLCCILHFKPTVNHRRISPLYFYEDLGCKEHFKEGRLTLFFTHFTFFVAFIFFFMPV